jgi:hypothetical protein
MGQRSGKRRSGLVVPVHLTETQSEVGREIPQISGIDQKPVRMVRINDKGDEFPLAQHIVAIDATFFTTGLFPELGDQARFILTTMGRDKETSEPLAFSGFMNFMDTVRMISSARKTLASIPLSRR